MPNVGKITIRCDKKNNDEYDLDLKFKKDNDDDAEGGGNGPGPNDEIKAEATIEVKVTNPCTWVRIGGVWTKICW
jgi:hypothetical protein